MFVVINCDFIDSRKNKNFDKILQEKLKLLNKKFSFFSLETNINVSRGDEIQFIIKLNNNFFKIIRYLRGILHPLKLRIGMGFIENLNITSKNSWDLNGEGFFLAREALDKIKDNKNISTRICSHNKEIEATLNIFYNFNDLILEEWKDKNWELNNLKIENSVNRKIIEHLKISSSTFYDRLKSSKLEAIEKNEKIILNLLLKEDDNNE